MRMLVTGGAGFIGSHVAERLLKDGHEVLVIDDLSGGREENVPAGARFSKAKVETLRIGEWRPDVVYHLAAYAAEGLSHHIPGFNYRNNLDATVHLLSECHRTGVKHFVFSSSIAVYGHGDGRPFSEDSQTRPIDPYGIAKLACEQHVRAFRDYYGGPTFTIFRPHNVFGERQNISDPYRNVVGIFMRCARLGLPFPIFGDGKQTRAFSYVSSVAEAIALAPFAGAAENGTFNIGGSLSMSVNQLAECVSAAMGVECRMEYLPPRREALHASCTHGRSLSVFPQAYAKELSIMDGLRAMAAWVKTLPEIPPPTPCPSPVEIADNLPPSWAKIEGS